MNKAPPKKTKRSRPLAADSGRTARYAAGETSGIARNSGVSPVRSKADEQFVLSRGGFAKISAVEGIHLTPEMKRDMRDFDRKGLSAAERRRAILNKYGRKAT